MKTVHLHVRHSGRTTTLVFPRFPIRIGREAPCECRLAFQFVSRAHATLELHGGRLMLRDIGSRGGTFVRNHAVRLEQGEYVDLENVGWEFQIGRLWIRAQLLDDGTQTPGTGTSAASARDQDDPNGTNETRAYCPPDNATRAYDGAGYEPSVLHEQAVRAELADLLARYRAARAELEACVRDTACAPETPGRAEAILALGSPSTDSGDERRSTMPPPPSTPARHEMEIALRGLQELASFYIPYAPPLVDGATVTRFHRRLDLTLRVMCDGFAALRFIQRPDEQRTLRASGTGIDVGARLLDWTSSDDALALFEAEIVEMIRHRARLEHDVSSGIAKLFGELDPDRIESAGGRSWLRAFQYRRFWETYRYRHHRLSSEDSLASLFGPRVRGIQRSLCGSPERSRGDSDSKLIASPSLAT